MMILIDSAREAETITGVLKDEAPLINWLVEYDNNRAMFEIRANILVNDIPIGAMYPLSIERYQAGIWLNQVKGEIAHLIAYQLLKKPGK